MKLPVVSGSDAVKAFAKAGYVFDEQHGSHMIVRRGDPPHRRLSVPNHAAFVGAPGVTEALREAGRTLVLHMTARPMSPMSQLPGCISSLILLTEGLKGRLRIAQLVVFMVAIHRHPCSSV